MVTKHIIAALKVSSAVKDVSNIFDLFEKGYVYFEQIK